MHSHTKLERSVATNDTTLTNDQRNKLDNNPMPVRALPLTTCLAATLNFLCASACPHTYHATIKETLCTVLAWPAPPQPDPCTAGPLRPSTCAKPDLSAMLPEITRQANLCSEPC
jgi:hypothetical protein